jgi:hypothetical protein
MTMIKLVARPLAALSVFAFGTLCFTACSSGPQGTTDAPTVTRQTVAPTVTAAPPGIVLGAPTPGRYYSVKNVVLHGKDAPSVTEYWVSETERDTALAPSHSRQVEATQINPCPNGAAWQLFDEPNYGGNVICFTGNGGLDGANLGDYSDNSCFWNGFEWICTAGLTWAGATRSWKGNSETAFFIGFVQGYPCNTDQYHPSCFHQACINPSNPNVTPYMGGSVVGDFCAYYAYALQFGN